MSLMTLNRFDKETASAILAEAILSRGASTLQSARAERYATEISELLDEVRGQLSLRDDDTSAEATGKIEHRLSREIRQIIMAGTEEQTLIEELGSEGRLPLSAYKLEFDRDTLKDFGESLKTIQMAVRSPNEVQHYTGSGELSRFVKGATLITKWVASAQGEPHWLLIVAQRQGEELLVRVVLRVSPSRIDLSNAKSPLEMLNAFIGKYGWDFTVPGLLGNRRFIVDTEVFGSPEEFPRKLVNPTGKIKLSEIGYAGHKARKDTGKIIAEDKRIILAYAINMTAYMRDKPRS